MANQVDNLLLSDGTTGLARTVDVGNDDIVLSTDLTLQAGGVFASDNIKRGIADPNAANLAGNEGDLYQQTLASSGQLWVNMDGTTTGWLNLNLGAGGNIEYGESLGNSSTTSSTYIEKLNVTTAVLLAGDYFIFWAYEWNLNATNRSFGARVQVDNLVTIAEQLTEPKNSDPTQFVPSSGLAQVTLTAAAHTVDIDYRAVGGVAPTATIRRARIALWRVN